MGHGMGGSARARALVARGCLALAVALAGVRPGAVAAQPATLKVIVLPPGRSLQLAAGSSRRFSATVAEKDVEYRWTIDGVAVGSDWSFDYAPESSAIGTHEVTVTVVQGAIATRHAWRVTVEPPPVPRIKDVAPSSALVRAEPKAKVKFRYVVASSVPTDEVEITWTVDGTRLGVGPVMDVEAKEKVGAARRVRAVAKSSLGVVQAREWRLVTSGSAPVAAGPGAVPEDPELTALVRSLKPGQRATSSTARPSTTTSSTLRTITTSSTPSVVTTTSTIVTAPAPPPTRIVVAVSTTSTVAIVARATTTSTTPKPRPTSTSTVPAARVATTTTRPRRTVTTTTVVVARAMPATTMPPPVVPPKRDVGIERGEVEAFLGRYARAYEARSVGELQRIGQITSPKQAEAMARYFEQIRDLRVDVEVLAIESRGDRATVRYRRRDRFRDPTGQVVDKETPPIEKEIRRTPSGLVFSPSS